MKCAEPNEKAVETHRVDTEQAYGFLKSLRADQARYVHLLSTIKESYFDAATEWDLTAAKRVLRAVGLPEARWNRPYGQPPWMLRHVRYGILVKQYTNRDPDYRRGP